MRNPQRKSRGYSECVTTFLSHSPTIKKERVNIINFTACDYLILLKDSKDSNELRGKCSGEKPQDESEGRCIQSKRMWNDVSPGLHVAVLQNSHGSIFLNDLSRKSCSFHL